MSHKQRMKAMAAAAEPKVEKTTPVKITRRLADAIADDCRPDRLDPAAKYGPLLETWVKRQYAAALAAARLGKIAEVVKDGAPKRDAVVRLPRFQVKRLGIVGSVTGKSVSEMVETKLWEMLDTK